MSNRFDWGAFKRPEGWVAFYRMVHHSENFILRDGKHDIIFATKDEAEKEAGKAFKAYLNSPISGMTMTTDDAKRSAELIFLKKPEAERAGK